MPLAETRATGTIDTTVTILTSGDGVSRGWGAAVSGFALVNITNPWEPIPSITYQKSNPGQPIADIWHVETPEDDDDDLTEDK